jgi:hypothetical protein
MKKLLFACMLQISFMSATGLTREKLWDLCAGASYSKDPIPFNNLDSFPVNTFFRGPFHTSIAVFHELSDEYIAYYSGYDGHQDSSAKYSVHVSKKEAVLAAIMAHPSFSQELKNVVLRDDIASPVQNSFNEIVEKLVAKAAVSHQSASYENMMSSPGILFYVELSKYIAYYYPNSLQPVPNVQYSIHDTKEEAAKAAYKMTPGGMIAQAALLKK